MIFGSAPDPQAPLAHRPPSWTGDGGEKGIRKRGRKRKGELEKEVGRSRGRGLAPKGELDLPSRKCGCLQAMLDGCMPDIDGSDAAVAFL